MRTILFRGKRKDKGTWIEGYYRRKDGYDYIYPVTYNSIRDCYKVQPETVSEMTGLKDINGVNIFEGDVIKTATGIIREIVFRHGSFFTKGKDKEGRNAGHSLQMWEVYPDMLPTVIGNIHDTPSLLKDTKEDEK